MPGPRPLLMPHSAYNAISLGQVPLLKSDLAQMYGAWFLLQGA